MNQENEGEGGLRFGVNTDSFFGIGFGLIGNKNINASDASDVIDALKEKFAAFFSLLNSYGISNIEINTEAEQLFPGFLSGIIFPMLKEQEIKSVSVHTPYLQLNPASPIEEYRRFSAAGVARIINACHGFGVERFIIHPTSEFEDSIMLFPIPEKEKKALIDIAVSQARKSLEEIIKATGIEPFKLAVENLEVFPFDYVYPIIKDYSVSICFDMGHWGLNGFMPGEFVEKFNPVSEIHIQDMTTERQGLRTIIRREHSPLGVGELKVGSFFDYLKSRRFDGSLIIENRSADDLNKSLEYLKTNGFLN